MIRTILYHTKACSETHSNCAFLLGPSLTSSCNMPNYIKRSSPNLAQESLSLGYSLMFFSETMAESGSGSADTENWQFHKTALQCHRHMLQTGIATDVTFHVSNVTNQPPNQETLAKVETKTFHAHRFFTCIYIYW